jgi:uncharacterized protein (TIGR02099 family)
MNPRRIGKFLLLTVGGLAVSAGLLLLALELALDRAPRYQTQIKEWLHRETGYHIAFAAVSPAFRWYGPELYLSRLELRSRDDLRVLARAAGGRVGLDIWHLLQNGRLFALRVELDSPDILIDRLGPSEFALASEIVLGGERPAAAALTLDDLPAGTLVIRRGSISLRHWNPELPQLDLREVDLDLSRVSHFCSASLSARLPAVLGGQLSFTGSLKGGGRLDGLPWSAAANADGVSFPGWRRLLPEFLERLDAGTGEFQTSAHGRGAALERMDLKFGAQNVVTKLSDGANTRMDEVSAALSLTHADDRWTLLGRRVRVERGGRRDPNSEFDVSWRDDESGMLELEAKANYLRAEALLPLVGLMPQKVVRERLRELGPTGEWMDMRLSLARRSAADPWTFDARARFRDVGFAPVGHAPGLRGLSGEMAGNESAGHVFLDSTHGVFNWPNQFPQPIDLILIKTSLYWRRDAAELLLATSDLTLTTRDAKLHGKMAWHQPGDGGSPVLTMVDTVDDGNAGDARLYLPHEFLASGALQWLDRAFVAGRVQHADAVFDGPVRGFPFREGGGLFLVRCRVDHMILDYREDWPRIENLSAQAEFRNQGMDVKVSSAEVADLKVDSGEARFADFDSGELEVHAAAHGGAAAAVHYLASTPLDAMAEHAFSSVQATGSLKAGIDLFFPFKQFEQRRVLVHVDLDGASVRRNGFTVAATDLTGGADLDGAQVMRADIRGRLLGGPVQITARAPRTRQSTRTHLDFRGTLSGDAVRSALSLPAGIAISGQAEYRAVLRIAPDPARERTLSVSSSLVGLELELPAPLTKPAGAAMPSMLAVQWPVSGPEEIRANLGAVLRGTALLDADSNGPKLARAAVAFGDGDPAFSDTQTVNVGGNIGELDLAGWLKLLGPGAAPGPGAGPGSGAAPGSGAGPGPSAATGASSAPGASAPRGSWAAYFRVATVEVAKIDYLGFTFRDVSLTISQPNGGWRIQAAGPNVAGSISMPGAEDPSAPWDLQFERLRFTESPGAPTGSAPDDADHAAVAEPQIDPRSIPPMDFHAAELTWDDRQFGDVRATLRKLDDGVSLSQLTVFNATWGANATGEWRGRDGGTSRIRGTITSTDVGGTLKDLGFAPVLQAKSGHLEFDMGWSGAPTGDALAAASGHVQVALEKGQIVGLKPGAGRVLGLASLAELPRRLALDFSDLTDKGFAFDTARGDFDLHDGSAHTDDVLVKGPAAEIGLIGRVGLKSHDYDQTAVVTGNVSSTLPLAAFAAGPVVGGAVLLFTQVFKQPLKGLVRGYYRITGSWDNPTVERIKSADAPPASVESTRETPKETPKETQ